MSMSTMSTIFSENAEQSSSTKFSDELTTALAAGRWWAIVEVSHPISEEPEYGDLISGQWGETLEAGEASCPTSLVFSVASEKAQRRFQHSGFSDAKLKTTKQWRQKTMQGAPVPSRSKQGAPVPASSEKGDLTSSLVFSDSSEKAPNSDLSGATLKTMEQQRKQRKKKRQGQAKAAGSEKTEGGNLTSFPVFSDASEKAMKQHEVAPVPFRSPRGPPVPAGSQQRGKLSIPEHLTNCLQKASFEQGARMPSVSPHGAPMPEKIPDRQKLKIPELLKWELLKQKPLASPLKTAPVSCTQGVPIIDKISEKRNLKNPELPRKELLEKDAIIPDTTPVGAPMHVGTQQGAVPPRYPHAAPVSAGSPKGAAVSAHTKKLQASCALAQTLPGAPITSPQGAPIFPRLRAPITFPQGAIFPHQRAPISSPQRAPITSPQRAPIYSPQRAPITSPQRAPITSPQRAPIYSPQRAPITSPQRAPIYSPQRAPITSPQRAPIYSPQRAPITSPQRAPIYSPQRAPITSPQGAPITSPQGAPIFSPQRAPITSPQGAPISSPQRAPITSPQGAPIFSPQRAPITSPQGAPITSPQRAPITSPQGAPITSPQSAPITSPQGAPITSPQRASMPRQRKRVCPWSTAASDNADLCQSPSQKLCVEIDDLIEKVQLILKLDSYNHRAPLIATSQLNQGTQSSLQPWKIALDNAGVDQSLPQKKAAYGNQSRGPTVGAKSNGVFMEHVR